jgi:hypothetical protein
MHNITGRFPVIHKNFWVDIHLWDRITTINRTLSKAISSVADPGCFIPDQDPTIAPSRIWIRPLLHPVSGSRSRIRGVKKPRIPDSTYFCIKAIIKFCLLIPDPTIAPSRILDPGGKKAPRIRICNSGYIYTYL